MLSVHGMKSNKYTDFLFFLRCLNTFVYPTPKALYIWFLFFLFFFQSSFSSVWNQTCFLLVRGGERKPPSLPAELVQRCKKETAHPAALPEHRLCSGGPWNEALHHRSPGRNQQAGCKATASIQPSATSRKWRMTNLYLRRKQKQRERNGETQDTLDMCITHWHLVMHFLQLRLLPGATLASGSLLSNETPYLHTCLHTDNTCSALLQWSKDNALFITGKGVWTEKLNISTKGEQKHVQFPAVTKRRR